MPKIVDRQAFIVAALKKFGGISTITRTQIAALCEDEKMDWPFWLTNDKSLRAGRGIYQLAEADPTDEVFIDDETEAEVEPVAEDIPLAAAAMAPSVAENVVPFPEANKEALPEITGIIPTRVTGYVPFGHFKDVQTIIKSRRYYPIYVTGLSGNGKTMMIEQVCAVEKRECIRVNITIETDEDDLLGGFRLIEGQTVWQDGPVVTAMERGAVLLLDEVDLGSNKMMCLQPVLEGKGVYLKKVNRLVKPAAGFTVVATANTKGKGSEDGRFIGTNVMNEAFLERFSITLEQEYPSLRVEEKILTKLLRSLGADDPEFAEMLVKWADISRKSFYEGATTELISTRRLVHICEAFAIFGQKREKSINLCLNRFDADTKKALLALYQKVDENSAKNEDPPSKSGGIDEEVAF